MVAFFCQHAHIPAVQVDETEVLAGDSLFATPEGETVAAGATPIYETIAARARELEAQRAPLGAETLRAELGRLLALPDERPLPHYRIPRPVRGEAEVLARYAVETEDQVRALLFKYLAQPAYAYSLDVEPTAHLYLPHVSAEAELAEDPFVASLKASPPLYALDVRGLGASMPEEERPEFFQPYGMDYMFHAYGLMLGRSYLGRRVYDVLCTIDLLAHEGAKEVHLYGRGQGALLALYAALFHEAVASATLVNGPRSYREWTQVPLVAWPAPNFLPGVLEVCDLPDIIRALGDVVRVIDPWGADMGPIST
jgi:hypothetical protein